MKDDIDKTIKRTQQYWFIDGLTEIAVGIVFLLIGVLFLVEAAAPPDSPMAHVSALGLPVLVIVGWLVARRLVAAAKVRLTYPRTGYVRYRARPASQRINRFVVGALVGAATALLVAAVGLTTPASLAWIPALEGLFVGLFWLYYGHQVSLTRFYVLGGLSVMIGAVVALSGAGDILGNGMYFGLMGLALIGSGALTLWDYVHHTQSPGEDPA